MRGKEVTNNVLRRKRAKKKLSEEEVQRLTPTK
jgi:hypothetical protein